MFTEHGTFIIGFSVSSKHLAVSPAVSYTHLDVYKRQNEENALRDKRAFGHFIAQKRKEAGLTPVSYTHLAAGGVGRSVVFHTVWQ